MQKLVKRKMHYETIMPVEAYEGEDDWKDEIALGLTLAGCGAAIVTGNVPGMTLCAAALLNEGMHHEPTVEFAQDVMEANVEVTEQRLRAEADVADAVFGAIATGVGALYDGAVAVYDGATAAAGAIVDAVDATTLSNDGPPP